MTARYIYRRRRWRMLFGTVDALGGLFGRPRPSTPDYRGAKSILVVKPDQVGDLILTLPLLAALRRMAPEARIEIAVGADRARVLAGTTGIDGIHELPLRMRQGEGRNDIRYGELRRAVRGLRARRFDAVVAAKEEPWTVLLAHLIHAPIRAGFREGGLGFLLTHFVPIPERGRHQWEILVSLSGADPAAIGPPRYPLTTEALAEAAELEEAWGGDRRLPLVIVHPGSGVESRRWPFPRFLEAVTALAASSPARFVFVGGPDEGSVSPSLPELSPPSQAVACRHALSLPLFGALLSRADLLIGNESAPSHLAAAVGTPAVVPFLSGNDPARWGPAGAGHAVIAGPRGVGPRPEAVAEAAAEALRRHDRTA